MKDYNEFGKKRIGWVLRMLWSIQVTFIGGNNNPPPFLFPLASRLSPSSSATRYEVKIPLPAHWSADVDTWVRGHPAHWRVAYPPRQVNNVYFDTHALTALNANLSGIGERTKLRLRWYGTDLGCVAGAQLELKCKSGMAGWKDIAAVSADLDLATQTWRAAVAVLRAAIPAPAQLWLAQFAVPVLINSYQRAYYATPDGALRLTVDTDLRAYPQRTTLAPNLTRRAALQERLIVELKAPITDARRLSAALTHFPSRVDRFSKYVNGLKIYGSEI